jgi:hypothetical protein
LQGKDNEIGFAAPYLQGGGNLQTTKARQHRDVWLLVAHNFESSFALSNLREYFEPAVFAQQIAQPSST